MDINTRQSIDAFLQSISVNKSDLQRQGFFPMSMWGKDHWSLLGYIFTRNMDYNCCIDYAQIRVNPPRHPYGGDISGLTRRWDKSWGSRLKGYFLGEGNTNPNLLICDHDDIDCIHDFEAEGLVVLGTAVSGYVALTEKGRVVAAELMKFKAAGGSFARFEYVPVVA